jgi:hypothetical protein
MMDDVHKQLARAKVLLKATHDILQKSANNHYVEEVLAMTVHYDDAECDGACLMDDIGGWFDMGGEPLPD